MGLEQALLGSTPTRRDRTLAFLALEFSYQQADAVTMLQFAGVAQLVEQLPCKQQVNGSSPFASFSVKRFI